MPRVVSDASCSLGSNQSDYHDRIAVHGLLTGYRVPLVWRSGFEAPENVPDLDQLDLKIFDFYLTIGLSHSWAHETDERG